MILTVLRWASLSVILGVSVWLLWPETGDEVEEERRTRDAKHVIRFSPGMSYMPGTSPFGIGAQLEGFRQIAREFEAIRPDTQIEFLNVPVVREYLVTQLSGGQAPDIINVNVEDVWVDIHKGWYVPLDPWLEAPNIFIREQGDPSQPGYDQWWDMFKYQAVSRGKAAPDGLNYCLTFDMIETGVYYNKNIFAEVGVDIPETWEEFIEIMGKIKEARYIPILMVIDNLNDWAVDLMFDQLYHEILPGIDLIQDPVREQYLEGYLDGEELTFLFQEKGFFSHEDNRYRELWRLLYEYRQYCNQNIATIDMIREFVTQQAAMIWNSSPLTYRLAADRELGFEWGVFYLPPMTRKTSPYASGVDMCVIGGSATQLEVTNRSFSDTGDPATSERLVRVMEFLQFITVPENYDRVVNEYTCFLPNIIGVEPREALRPFAEILERRYTTTKWTFSFDLKFSEIQRRMLELYLNDGINLDEFMDWQVSNMDAATLNMLRRVEIDLDEMHEAWDRLAPVREDYFDLPTQAMEE